MKTPIKVKVAGGIAVAAGLLGGGAAYGSVWHQEQVSAARAAGMEAGQEKGALIQTLPDPVQEEECNLKVTTDGITLNDAPVTYGSRVRFATANGFCTDDDINRWVRAVAIETEHRPKVDRVKCFKEGLCMVPRPAK